MISAIDRKKIAKLVLTTSDDNILEKIKSLISTEKNAEQNGFIEKYNKEIDKAVAKIRGGKFYTQEEAESLLAAWEKE